MLDSIAEEDHHDLIQLAKFMVIYARLGLIVKQELVLGVVPKEPITQIKEGNLNLIALIVRLDFTV